MLEPDPSAVVRVARAVLGDPTVAVLSWDRTPLAWLAIAPTTADLARYSGATADGRRWSAIRKVLRPPESRWTAEWRREADVYASGFLSSLPPGIAAPRVYAIDDMQSAVSLWLEDVVESVPMWPLSRYEVAARHLGLFNGAFLAGRVRPTAPPLRPDWLAGWVAMTSERATEVLGDASVIDHELVRRALSPMNLDRMRALHTMLQRLLAALERLPTTVSHLDAWRANLIARDTPDVQETVAIDWSLLGLAPAGQEVAVFVTGARVWLTLKSDEAAALGELSFSSYLGGLRDAGWTGSEDDVRLAYTASVALWSGSPAPLWLRWFTLPARREWLERKFAMTLEDAAQPFGEFLDFALDLADEALADPRV